MNILDIVYRNFLEFGDLIHAVEKSIFQKMTKMQKISRNMKTFQFARSKQNEKLHKIQWRTFFFGKNICLESARDAAGCNKLNTVRA